MQDKSLIEKIGPLESEIFRRDSEIFSDILMSNSGSQNPEEIMLELYEKAREIERPKLMLTGKNVKLWQAQEFFGFAHAEKIPPAVPIDENECPIYFQELVRMALFDEPEPEVIPRNGCCKAPLICIMPDNRAIPIGAPNRGRYR